MSLEVYTITMVRKVEKTASASVPAVVPPIVQVSEPDVANVPVKKAAKKAEGAAIAPVAKTVVPPIVAPVGPSEDELKNEIVAGSLEGDKKGEIASRFGEFAEKLHKSTVQLNALRAEFKQLEKQLLKDIKSLQKSKGKKHKHTSGNRKPSGFTCPTLISNELAAFLGKPDGAEMARTEVSKELTKYINDHKLKDPANGRNILPDDKLVALLKIGKDEKLNIFNIHRYMKPHFIKSAAAK